MSAAEGCESFVMAEGENPAGLDQNLLTDLCGVNRLFWENWMFSSEAGEHRLRRRPRCLWDGEAVREGLDKEVKRWTCQPGWRLGEAGCFPNMCPSLSPSPIHWGRAAGHQGGRRGWCSPLDVGWESSEGEPQVTTIISLFVFSHITSIQTNPESFVRFISTSSGELFNFTTPSPPNFSPNVQLDPTPLDGDVIKFSSLTCSVKYLYKFGILGWKENSSVCQILQIYRHVSNFCTKMNI